MGPSEPPALRAPRAGGLNRARPSSPRRLTTVAGTDLTLPDDELLTHLQLRRFAGCPICDLHLRSFARRHDEIAAAAIHEVVVFHSPAEDLRPFIAELPFDVVPDPDKRLYQEFGIESARRALLDPRAWGSIVLGVAIALPPLLRGRKPAPPPAHGGRLGLPGDFLISPDGRVIASRYGKHAADHWSVDEVLALASRSGG